MVRETQSVQPGENRLATDPTRFTCVRSIQENDDVGCGHILGQFGSKLVDANDSCDVGQFFTHLFRCAPRNTIIRPKRVAITNNK
jgi:hypothetical protein